MKTKAILIGASGRVGQALARELSTLYETVILITRTQPRVMSANMHVYQVTDFQMLATTIESMSVGADTDAFSCLGVPKSQVASMDEFHQVNVLYNVEFAKACHKKGVNRFFYLSKQGADNPANNQELIAKADVEYYLQQLNFDELIIFRLAKLTAPKQKFSIQGVAQLLLTAKETVLSAVSLDKQEPLTPRQVAASISLLAYQLHQRAHHKPAQKLQFITHEDMCRLARVL